ncbi:FHA domain-containing protein [Aphelenchoides fujianensis]|nr:FHA domain-containing protein [Aphelenchoides fujianensis]
MYRKIVTPPREEEGGLTLAAQNAVNAIANDLGAGPAYYSTRAPPTGPFVNNYRLSNNAEESQPKLLRSGDILQLGVEIVDNSKNVASGCITCILRLVDERGEECLGPPEENPLSARMPHSFGESVPHNCSLISNEKLFVMSQYMKEAMHREKMLTEKLRSLESLLEMTRESAERGWKALINEERLLARIEILESQLTCAKAAASGNADEMLERVNAMLEDQGKAEEELRVKLIAHQEKIYDAETTAENFKHELEGQKKENQWLQSRNDELVAQLEHARDEYQMLLEERKENENGAAKAAANGAFSVSRVEDAPVTKPALEQSTANEDGLKADEEPNSANLDHSVELEVNPFADELSDSKADAAEDHAHPSPPHAVQPEAPPPVFFQEAEVQTDPVEQPAPSRRRPRSRQPKRVEQPNVDVLFTSVFPLAIFLGVFLERLFRWLPDRPPAALEQPEAEDADRLKKES